MKPWHYNEFNHCGVDYSTMEQAEKYDAEHQKFRDYEEEYSDMLNILSLNHLSEMSIIDFGCGTGAMSICAAKDFKRVYAVDVSETMLKQAAKKADKMGIKNIDFIHAGFLSYNHIHEPVDLAITKAALHHLPDFWKQIALLNINKCLKMNGFFYLFDIVFSVRLHDIEKHVDGYIDGYEQKAGMDMKKEVETHIQNEFSTFDWIIKGMLERAGFEVIRDHTFDGFSTEFFCRKIKDIQ